MGIIDSRIPQPDQQQPQSDPTAQDSEVASTSKQVAQALGVSPQMQEVYQRIVAASMNIIYSPESHGQIVNMLKSGVNGDMSSVLVKTTMTIVQEITRMSKPPAPPEIMVPAAAEILVLLAELSTKARIQPIDLPTIAKAMQMGLQNLGQMMQIPPQQMQEWMAAISPEKMQSMVAQQNQGMQDPQNQAVQQPTEQ